MYFVLILVHLESYRRMEVMEASIPARSSIDYVPIEVAAPDMSQLAPKGGISDTAILDIFKSYSSTMETKQELVGGVRRQRCCHPGDTRLSPPSPPGDRRLSVTSPADDTWLSLHITGPRHQLVTSIAARRQKVVSCIAGSRHVVVTSHHR